MNQSLKLDAMIPVVWQFLEDTGYRKTTITRYKVRGLEAIRQYYAHLGAEDYSEKLRKL